MLLTVGRENRMPPGRVDEFVWALGSHAETALALDSMQDLSLTAPVLRQADWIGCSPLALIRLPKVSKWVNG